jgi:DNA replication and repair protein RecF
MAIQQIRINNLRILEEVELEPAPGLNLICGKNGSGKTSILEAVYLLGRGRSFRNAEQEQLTRKGQRQLTLFARIQNDHQQHAIGFAKMRGVTQAKLNGERVTRMSDLARAVPLTVITPNSHEILERGPQYRRRILDWGVFHVEQNFRNAFERYSRCLKQRNAAIKIRAGFDATWDKELAETGEEVNAHRERYQIKLAEKIIDLAAQLLDIGQIEIGWNRGWSEKGGLGQILKDSTPGDLQAGYTRYGPHRADLSIKLKGQKVEKIASRGQQKMLVAIMHLAQVDIARELSGTDTIVLIDDLTSELDSHNRRILLQHLERMQNQVLITGVDDISRDNPYFSKLFHVEHGTVSQS